MCSCSFSVCTTPSLTWSCWYSPPRLYSLTHPARAKRSHAADFSGFSRSLEEPNEFCLFSISFCTGAWLAEMWNKIVHLAAHLLSLNEVGEQALACVWITKTCKQAVSAGKNPHSRKAFKAFALKFYLTVHFFFYPLNIMERIKVYW